MLTEAELVALRLLLQRPGTTVISRAMMESLGDKALIERRAGSLQLTSRGHAALLESDRPSPR